MELTSKKLEVAARYLAGVMLTAASIVYLHGEVDNMLNPKPIITEFNGPDLVDLLKVEHLIDVQSQRDAKDSPSPRLSIGEVAKEVYQWKEWITKNETLSASQKIGLSFAEAVCDVHYEKTQDSNFSNCTAFPRGDKTVLTLIQKPTLNIPKPTCKEKAKHMSFESCDEWMNRKGNHTLTILEPRYL